METADVREHFLLTVERRGRLRRKLARRCDVRIDSTSDCVCLRACRCGCYQQKQCVLKNKEKSRILAGETKDKPSVPFPHYSPDNLLRCRLTDNSDCRWSQLENELKTSSSERVWRSGIIRYLCSIVGKKTTDLSSYWLMYILYRLRRFIPRFKKNIQKLQLKPFQCAHMS